MANDAQHSQWRQDAHHNIQKAVDAVNKLKEPSASVSSDRPQGVQAEIVVDLAAAVIPGLFSISERINEQGSEARLVWERVDRAVDEAKSLRDELNLLTSQIISGHFDEDIIDLKEQCENIRERRELDAHEDEQGLPDTDFFRAMRPHPATESMGVDEGGVVKYDPSEQEDDGND